MFCAEDRTVRIVLQHDEFRSPEHDDLRFGRQQHAHGAAQALGPCVDRSKGRFRPIQRAHPRPSLLHPGGMPGSNEPWKSSPSCADYPARSAQRTVSSLTVCSATCGSTCSTSAVGNHHHQAARLSNAPAGSPSPTAIAWTFSSKADGWPGLSLSSINAASEPRRLLATSSATHRVLSASSV